MRKQKLGFCISNTTLGNQLALRDWYLKRVDFAPQDMTKNPATRCPVAALGAEVWGSQSGILGVGRHGLCKSVSFLYL